MIFSVNGSDKKYASLNATIKERQAAVVAAMKELQDAMILDCPIKVGDVLYSSQRKIWVQVTNMYLDGGNYLMCRAKKFNMNGSTHNPELHIFETDGWQKVEKFGAKPSGKRT